jgi:hypothetical protein
MLFEEQFTRNEQAPRPGARMMRGASSPDLAKPENDLGGLAQHEQKQAYRPSGKKLLVVFLCKNELV